MAGGGGVGVAVLGHPKKGPGTSHRGTPPGKGPGTSHLGISQEGTWDQSLGVPSPGKGPETSHWGTPSWEGTWDQSLG